MFTAMFAGLYSSSPTFIKFSVPPTANTEVITPIISASCCFEGVAPTRYPVFKSCEVPPAFDDATHTTPPIVSASAENAAPVQCATKNIAHVAISVAIAIPLIGFDEFPISPQIRDETVTNKNPNTTTNTAAIRFDSSPVFAPGIGRNVSSTHIIATIASEPSTTIFIEKSRSTRLTAVATAFTARLLRISFSPALSADTIVGSVFTSVITPAAATAPAPIGRIYDRYKSSGVICPIGINPGKSGCVISPPKNLIVGISTSHEKTPPANSSPATRGPMMYPTPIYSGVMFARIDAPGSHPGLYSGVSGQNPIVSIRNAYSPPSPTPQNTRLANDPPLSPATSTSAHAVPSG